MKSRSLNINLDYDHLLDFVNLAIGLFQPLTGFMKADDFYSVVNQMTLKNGAVFTIPIILPVKESLKQKLNQISQLNVTFNGLTQGFVKIEDIYNVKDKDFYQVFGTKDTKHPGLKKHLQESWLIVGGQVTLTNSTLIKDLDILTPTRARKIFQQKGWETIVGFQTRNAIHRAHEHLQRIGLEICDGLFINPLVGWKKTGDFTEEAISAAYDVMAKSFYPKNRIYFHGLRTAMRYAGPREAIFHALIRRNLGCTHFIIGRDHAGVGNYYGQYQAHDLARTLKKKYNLGIELLLLDGPFYCQTCQSVVTRKTCGHQEQYAIPISGTIIRQCLEKSESPPDYMMRPEIVQAILKCKHPLII